MSVYEKPFDKAEYAKRVADTKKRMQTAGFDLIICQDPANMCWLTGFNAGPSMCRNVPVATALAKALAERTR